MWLLRLLGVLVLIALDYPVGTYTVGSTAIIVPLLIIGWFAFGSLCIVGVILGHISLKQLKTSGEGGRGMALTGLIMGYIGIAGWVIGLIIFFVVLLLVTIVVALLGIIGIDGHPARRDQRSTCRHEIHGCSCGIAG